MSCTSSTIGSTGNLVELLSAVFAQVHKAVLKSGEDVVVKVQRPGLKALFDIDLEQLRILAKRLVVLTKPWEILFCAFQAAAAPWQKISWRRTRIC